MAKFKTIYPLQMILKYLSATSLPRLRQVCL
ncbi:F-box protein [Ruminococcus intestinalis]